MSIILGKVLTGSLVSSAMLTESSKPTMAKNARAVAEATAVKRFEPSLTLNWVRVAASPLPCMIAHTPMAMMMSRPDSSTMVRTTLTLTLSPTPRRLMIATRAMKPRAASRSMVPPDSQPKWAALL